MTNHSKQIKLIRFVLQVSAESFVQSARNSSFILADIKKACRNADIGTASNLMNLSPDLVDINSGWLLQAKRDVEKGEAKWKSLSYIRGSIE
jgi:hypothetical protein